MYVPAHVRPTRPALRVFLDDVRATPDDDGLRLILAAFEDGRALALAALRPTGATGHDRDSVAVQLTESGDPVPLTEALVSTEYDAEGLPRRVGAELWAEPDSPPMRLAGDRHGEVKVDAGEPRREAVRMSFRLEGVGGVGTYEEFFEILVGRHLEEHGKPIGVVNSRGYYNPLIAMMEHGIEHRFIPESMREQFFIEPEARAVVERLAAQPSVFCGD